MTIRDFYRQRISDPLRSVAALKNFDPLRDIFKGGYLLRNNPRVSRRADIRSVTLYEKNAPLRTDDSSAVETVKDGFSTEWSDPLSMYSVPAP